MNPFGYELSIAAEVAEAVHDGYTTHEDVTAAIERALLRRSTGLPLRRVLYNGRRGFFEFSEEFRRFRSEREMDGGASDPSSDIRVVMTKVAAGPTQKERTEYFDLLEDFGRRQADEWPVAARILTILASENFRDILWFSRGFRRRFGDESIRCKKRARRQSVKGAANAASLLGAKEPCKLVEKLIGAPSDAPSVQGRTKKGASATLQKLLEKGGESDVEAWVDFARDVSDVEIKFLLENHAAFENVEVDPLVVGLGFASGTKCSLRVAKVPALLAIEISEYDGDEDVRWDGWDFETGETE